MNYLKSKLTVITPVFKNAETLEELTQKVFSASEHLFADVEYIFVNDGSPDDTRNVLKKLTEKDKRVKAINLVRNFGQHAALCVGMRYATGDYIFIIDGDLEENPNKLPDLLEKLQEGYEIVTGIRKNPRSSWFKQTSAEFYNWVHNKLSDYKIVGNRTSMSLMTKRYVEYLLKFKERPYLAGYMSWIGLPIGYVEMEWEDQGRKSGYSLKKLLKHGRAGIIGFSTKLVRTSLVVGFLVSAVSFLYGISIIVNYFMHSSVAPGFSSLAVLISFFMGVQFIFIGILGEYVVEIFLAVKNRPESIVYDEFGWEQN